MRFMRAFSEGLIARMMSDEATARSAFTAARAKQEKIVEAEPNYGPLVCVLGLIDRATPFLATLRAAVMQKAQHHWCSTPASR